MITKPPAARGGFTIVELLVTLGIIGLLMALLVPAVMAARESARKTQCQSNLAQVGRAMHDYASAHGRFPPSIQIDAETGDTITDRQYAPQVFLLPYVEQSPLYRRVDPSAPSGGSPYAPPYHEGGDVVVPVYVCPSDPVDGGNNYRVCTGSSAYSFEWPVDDETETADGAIAPGGLTAGDITDGLSNTVAASEKRKSDHDTATFDPATDMWFTAAAASGNSPSTAELVELCASLTVPPTDFHAHAGRSWLPPGFHHTWYNHVLVPNAAAPDCTSNSPMHAAYPIAAVAPASSHHSGGVNVLLMDGAVRFVADEVDLAIWRAAATRAGGEAAIPF